MRAFVRAGRLGAARGLATASPLLYSSEELTERYAAVRPPYPDQYVSSLLRLARLPASGLAGDVAVDVATGTGQAAAPLTRHFRSVIAIDSNAAQLAHVSSDEVDFRVGTAEALPVGDGVADLLLAAQSFHWFDSARFFSEARRVLKPDGVLALSVYGPGMQLVGEEAATEVLLDVWGRTRQALPWADFMKSHYADLQTPEGFGEWERLSLPLTRTLTLHEVTGFVSTWACLNAACATAEAKAELLAETRRRLSEALREPAAEQGFEVQWPCTILCARASPPPQ